MAKGIKYPTFDSIEEAEAMAVRGECDDYDMSGAETQSLLAVGATALPTDPETGGSPHAAGRRWREAERVAIERMHLGGAVVEETE